MLCFLCGKKIGLLRSLLDQQYCSSEHRKEARLASSQALRDEEDVETWAVAKSRAKDKNARKLRPATTMGQTASVFAFLTVGALLVAAMLLPGPKASGPAFPAVWLDPAVKKGFVARASDAVGEMIRSSTPITLRQTFSSGSLKDTALSAKDWATVRLASAEKIDDPRDWLGKSRSNLSSLRLWKSSASLHNYQIEFQGTLEKSSLSWAFRASENGDHYAAKLSIIKPGALNAGLLRYSMVNGHESDRIQLPVPATLERGADYRIRLSVQDDHFITYLNGQMISSWTDDRLRHGGVGFFDDPDDPQKISWVSLSERDSFLGRMLAHFSLLIVPGEPSGQ
jgi:hypothetical protein